MSVFVGLEDPPQGVLKKLKIAEAIQGPRFLHVLAPRPPGWNSPPEETVRLAVGARVFPLYEVDHGR